MTPQDNEIIKRVNVLALATDAWGGYGGIAQSTRDIMTAFASYDKIGSINILPRHACTNVDVRLRNIKQHPPCTERVKYIIAAFRLARSIKPEVIYCGHLFMVPLASLLATLFNSKLILHLHGVEIWEKPTLLCRFSLISIDLALCVSKDTQNRLLQYSNLSSDCSEVIYNTVAGDFTTGNRLKAREALGFGRKKVLLTVSRLDKKQRHKGHETVISLISGLRSIGHDVVYLIAGEGDDRSRLEKLASRCGVAEYVRFLGYVSREQLPDLYRAADLYVMPSKGEGFGIAFVEAMACGTPALGLAVGGASDALCNGKLGTAVSLEAFPTALKEALIKPECNRTELSLAVHSCFGQDAYQDRIHKVLEKFIG